MRVLAIETSCDETAAAIVEAVLQENIYSFNIIADALNSQAELHAEFGGVYPTLAKREHIRNLAPLIASVMAKADIEKFDDSSQIPKEKSEVIKEWLSHEPELVDQVMALAQSFNPRNIDGIAVTVGPGLAPALWVGINVARSLSILWNKPLIPINHMEGHFISGFYEGGGVEYPVLGLLVSGGHTELVLSKEPFHYEVIGATRDDAAGEAFDKGARILGLPYPGGAELSRIAREHRAHLVDYKEQFHFPRPMIHSGDLDFSYSGLKTSLRYLMSDLETEGKNIEELKPAIAREYEGAILDCLIKKTEKALGETEAQTLVVAGGVSANATLRERIEALQTKLGVIVKIPPIHLSTDNAVMIGMAGALRLERDSIARDLNNLKADGNLPIDSLPK